MTDYVFAAGPYLYADYALSDGLVVRLESQLIFGDSFDHVTIKPEVMMRNGLFLNYELLTGTSDRFDYSRNYIGLGWRF